MRRTIRNAVQDFRTRYARKRALRVNTRPDLPDPRAKSQRHGKVTADRWNQ
jgi:hypothetical protein